MSDHKGPDNGNQSDEGAKIVALPVFIFLFFFLAGMGLNMIWPIAVIPQTLQILGGLALILVGSAVLRRALPQFREAGTTVNPLTPATALITDGVFALSRNPLYLAMSLIYAGLAVLIDNIWALVLLIPTVIVIQIGVILPEERYLEEKFGDTYRAYKAKVRRWI